eukprot:scaffold1471_cov413-Prasinococcus_capsulatus_cf.AAC.6
MPAQLDEYEQRHKVELDMAVAVREEERIQATQEAQVAKEQLKGALAEQERIATELAHIQQDAHARVREAEEQTSQVKARVTALETELALASATARPKGMHSSLPKRRSTEVLENLHLEDGELQQSLMNGQAYERRHGTRVVLRAVSSMLGNMGFASQTLSKVGTACSYGDTPGLAWRGCCS